MMRIEGSSLISDARLSRGAQLAVDASIAGLALILAHTVRFDGWPPYREAARMFLILPYVAAGRVIANYFTGNYRRIWRYASLADAARMAASAGTISAILLVARLAFEGQQPYLTLPIGIIVIDYLLATSGMLGIRLLRRVSYESTKRTRAQAPGNRQRALLAGAGSAGVMTVREISRRPDLGIELCGFVDDDRSKRNTVIYDVPILGTTSDLPDLIESHKIDLVIITMGHASRKTIRHVVDMCETAGVPVKTIPALYEILENRVTISTLRAVEIEDLLGRESIDVSAWLESSKQTYFGKRVMVTGAGGSIGRILCQQLAYLEPSAIIMLDKDENAMFESMIDTMAAATGKGTRVYPVICDLRIDQRLKQSFERYQPHVVFHAAAHKHVPLMEENTSEAVLNNVVGTYKLLSACDEHAVERCVMVSTDKAVNPTSIMGATKRVSELMFQAKAVKRPRRSRYSCVRFGNVLGSRGSVVPTFREQIKKGGPVTITHPDMIRYFMTIPEAAQLIIQAGALGEKGEIFLLDMGEPVRVMDLAKDMIRLSGLTVGEDIEIEITGLRPGEKMREELLIAEEGARATLYDKIFVAPPLEYNLARLYFWVEQLTEAAYEGDDKTILEIFSLMGIGFRSDNVGKSRGPEAPEDEREQGIAAPALFDLNVEAGLAN
jgi:FlaA1/EpsC-like NDP-sugar epimerase